MLMNRFSVLLLALCALSFLSCSDDGEKPSGPVPSFRALGLEQRIVNELELHNTSLYAATDAGLFAKDLSPEADWQILGLAGKNVTSLVVLNATTLLAATANPLQEDFGLYRSTDGGQHWQQLPYTWSNGGPEPLNDFAYEAASNTLYASGLGVVAKSTDQGNSWTPVYGEWQAMAAGLAFVAINPASGDIWTGGQNAIEQFVLAKTTAANGQWQEWGTLLPSPSVAKSITFHPTNPQTVLVGGEDGILRSNTGGNSWSIIKQDHVARFYFGLQYDSQVPDRVYAASWDKNFDDPQPLLLHISEDGGTTWKEHRHAPAALFGGAWDMVLRKEGQTTKLYIGLYKGGVYEASID
jgi:photosystem II stability/assembly factor-like uncharacterized protein